MSTQIKRHGVVLHVDMTDIDLTRGMPHWTCVDDGYCGAPDSDSIIGTGSDARRAIKDYFDQRDERGEYEGEQPFAARKRA